MGFFYVHYPVHGTYSFTSHPKNWTCGIRAQTIGTDLGQPHDHKKTTRKWFPIQVLCSRCCLTSIVSHLLFHWAHCVAHTPKLTQFGQMYKYLSCREFSRDTAMWVDTEPRPHSQGHPCWSLSLQSHTETHLCGCASGPLVVALQT